MSAKFVSYRRVVSTLLAHLIATKFQRENIEAFVDTLDTYGIGPFPVRLYQAIESSNAFICLLAESTLDSEWVQNEIGHAHRLGKPMLPVFQESFVQPRGKPLDPAVQALLKNDGVHVLDQRGLYIPAALDMLVKIIRQTEGIPAPQAAPAGRQFRIGPYLLVTISLPKALPKSHPAAIPQGQLQFYVKADEERFDRRKLLLALALLLGISAQAVEIVQERAGDGFVEVKMPYEAALKFYYTAIGQAVVLQTGDLSGPSSNNPPRPPVPPKPKPFPVAFPVVALMVIGVMILSLLTLGGYVAVGDQLWDDSEIVSTIPAPTSGLPSITPPMTPSPVPTATPTATSSPSSTPSETPRLVATRGGGNQPNPQAPTSTATQRPIAVIDYFVADDAMLPGLDGERCTTVRWGVSGADSVTLTRDITSSQVVGVGSMQICPVNELTYLALDLYQNGVWVAGQSLVIYYTPVTPTITLRPSAQILWFYADEVRLSPRVNCTMIYWETVYADRVEFSIQRELESTDETGSYEYCANSSVDFTHTFYLAVYQEGELMDAERFIITYDAPTITPTATVGVELN